jgi:hypothetical protein
VPWLSKAGVLWAMDEAPGVPPHLVAALVAVARYADENGRGAHPSALTVATIIRKSERNAKRDLAALRKLGLLIPGDQRIVKDIRPDRRPFVYDLPMSRGVADDISRTTHGVSQATARGVAQVPSGVSQVTPEEFPKNSGRRAAPDRAGGASANAQPKKTFWPCPGCNEAFTDEDLVDDENRRRAMEGDLWHVECMEEFEASHPEAGP